VMADAHSTGRIGATTPAPGIRADDAVATDPGADGASTTLTGTSRRARDLPRTVRWAAGLSDLPAPVGLAALVLVATALSWARMTPTARDTVWAEDGVVFLGESARPGGSVLELLRPYAGYLHVVPRLVADVVLRVLPTEHASLGLALGNSFVVGLVTAVVYVCSSAVTSWVPARLGIALVTVLVPVAPQEVLGTGANLHWYFLWAAPWVLLYRPATRTAAWVLGVVVLLGSLTEIQMALFAPLLLVRLRDRRTWPVKGALVLGLLGQFIATVQAPRAAASAAPPDVHSVVEGYLLNGVLSLWVPASTAGRWVADHGWLVGVLALLPLLTVAGWVLWRGEGRQRAIVLVLLAGSVLAWTLAFVLNPNPTLYYGDYTNSQLRSMGYLRYAMVPSMLLLAVVPIAAAVAWRRSTLTRVAAVLGSIVVALALVAQFAPQNTSRSGGPTWSPQVGDAAKECAARPADPAEPILLAPEGWIVEFPCARLTDG
jgi:hypothetical protein